MTRRDLEWNPANPANVTSGYITGSFYGSAPQIASGLREALNVYYQHNLTSGASGANWQIVKHTSEYVGWVSWYK